MNYQSRELFEKAIKNKDLHQIQQLIAHGHKPNYVTLIDAADEGFLPAVQLLLQNSNVNPADNGNYAIGAAARNGHLDVVMELINDPRVDPNGRNGRTLEDAAWGGHLAMVQYLLTDPRVDVEKQGFEALSNAIEKNRVDIIQVLLQDPRIDPSQDEYSILWKALNPEMLNLLLADPRIYPSVSNNYGSVDVLQRMLLYSISKHDSKMASILVVIPRVVDSVITDLVAKNDVAKIQQLAMMTGAESPNLIDLMAWGAAIDSVELVRYLIDPFLNLNLAIDSATAYNREKMLAYLKTVVP